MIIEQNMEQVLDAIHGPTAPCLGSTIAMRKRQHRISRVALVVVAVVVVMVVEASERRGEERRGEWGLPTAVESTFLSQRTPK